MKGEKLESFGRQNIFYYYEIGGLMECVGVVGDHSRCKELQQRWLWQGEWQEYLMALERV